MNATPIVVIIGAVPEIPRSGRRQIRSMSTPRSPVKVMVAPKTRRRVPARGSPLSAFEDPVKPIRFRMVSPMKVPVMNTLKWAKLMSSMMP